jgi:hypothetical protein
MSQEKIGTYEVVWPRGNSQKKAVPAARRHASLDKVRIGFLWDVVFRGDEVFAHLEDGLRKTWPEVEFVGWEKFGSTHAENEREMIAGLPARLKELGVTAVISGMGC